jgi:tRNA A58 N-methylase Trm61
MKITIEGCELRGREIEVIANFAIEIEDLEKGSYSRQSEGIFNQVAKAVSEDITRKILAEKSADIIAQIDIDEIVKRIKLNIVQNVARG